MTEQDSKEKYIKCSRCKCKYINDDEHIKNDFGFTRLGEQFKTCMVCRTKRTQYHKDYYYAHKEQRQEYSRKYCEEHKDTINQRHRELYKTYRDEIYKQIVCTKCGKEVSKKHMLRHQESSNCKK